MASRVTIIDKGHVSADKNIIFNGDPLKNINRILKRDMISDPHSLFNKTAVADIAPFSDLGSCENIDESPNPRPGANPAVRADKGGGMFEVIVHFKISLETRDSSL